ncbi:MAG: class I SAM-dependent methyltransferase [Sphingobium sp.]
MSRSHESLVDVQFGHQAQAYVQSVVHAQGEDLDALEALAERMRPDAAIDLGAGGGHVAYRLAAHAKAVTAVDLSPSMIAAVEDAARQRALPNIATCVAPAESLPFDGASFDMLGCRFSAHHWRELDAGLREACRVLKPGAPAAFIDVISPGVPAFDTHLQSVELLRDPSHVRNFTQSEWEMALTRAGFRVRDARKSRLRMDYASWVERMRTPEPHRVAIRSLQQWADEATTRYFEIEEHGSFTVDTLYIEASVCRARRS